MQAGTGYLYAAANKLGIPTDVMFFPQDDAQFTAFDPATGVVTRLEFIRDATQSLTIVFANGSRIAAQR